MEIFIIISEIIIGLVFFIAGTFKLLKSYESLNKRMKWTNESSMGFVRLVSLLEIFGALLFVLPRYFGWPLIVSTIASIILAFLMIGAPITHLKLGEHKEATFTALMFFYLLYTSFFRFFI